MNLRIYNIWHNKLFPELYAGVSDDDMANIVMFGVNERYKKEVPAEGIRWNVQYEWDLDMYNPQLQHHGYCQTTAMYHIYKNGLHKGLDYIGFIQYDMRVKPDAFARIRYMVECGACILHATSVPTTDYYGLMHGIVSPYNGSALEHYNNYFGTTYTPDEVMHAGYGVLMEHTFIIPTPMFEKMMGWICSYIDFLESIFPDYPGTVSQAEFVERCHGLFFIIECIRDRRNVMVDMRPSIEHVWPLYRDKTEYDNYKVIIRD